MQTDSRFVQYVRDAHEPAAYLCCEVQPLGLELYRRYESTKKAVLAVTGHRELLQENSVLKRSIQVRNPYVDPLNLLQIELLQRVRNGDDDPATLNALLVTINGVAAGMRNTG